MKHDTANEACKHRKSVRYGGRRRRCISCLAARAVRAKKRGPKPAKRRTSSLRRTFADRLTIAQQGRLSSASADSRAKRQAKAPALLAAMPWPHRSPAGPLILVLDAMRFHPRGEGVTAYPAGLRAVDGAALHFLRPVLRPGNEPQKRRREVLDGVPLRTRQRILALVSEGCIVFAISNRLAPRAQFLHLKVRAGRAGLSRSQNHSGRAKTWLGSGEP